MANLQYVQAEVLYAGGAVTQWVDTAPTTLQAPDGIDAPAINYPYCPEQPPLPEIPGPEYSPPELPPSPPPPPTNPETGYPIAPEGDYQCGDFYEDEDGNVWESRSDYKTQPGYDPTRRKYRHSVSTRVWGMTNGAEEIQSNQPLALEQWIAEVEDGTYDYSLGGMPYEGLMLDWHKRISDGGTVVNVDPTSPYYGYTWRREGPFSQRYYQNNPGGSSWFPATTSGWTPPMSHKKWVGWEDLGDCSMCQSGACGGWGGAGCVRLEYPCATWTHWLAGQYDIRAFWVGAGYWTASGVADWSGKSFPLPEDTPGGAGSYSWALYFDNVSYAIKYLGSKEMKWDCGYRSYEYNPEYTYSNLKDDTDWDGSYQVSFGFAGWIQGADSYSETIDRYRPGGDMYGVQAPNFGQYVVSFSLSAIPCDWVQIPSARTGGYDPQDFEGLVSYTTHPTTGYTDTWIWRTSTNSWELWGGEPDFDGGEV